MTNVIAGGGFPPPPSGPPPGGFPPPPSGGGFPPPPGGGYPPPGGGGFQGGPTGGSGQLAEWQDRLMSGVIDFFGPWFVARLIYTVGGGVNPFSTTGGNGLFLVGGVLQIAAVGWALYNGYLAGQTGQSIGMKQSGLRLVGEQTGQPIGGTQGLVRNLLFIASGCCCWIVGLVDNLFPLWDDKKQTLRDKIAKSVVVKV